jgi:hypothetical protein
MRGRFVGDRARATSPHAGRRLAPPIEPTGDFFSCLAPTCGYDTTTVASSAAADWARNDLPESASDRGPVRVSLRRSRWRSWLLLLAILVAVRLALAIVFVPFAEESLSRVLGARVDVGDVSFAPIDAVVTLRNVVMHVADDAADAEPGITAGRVRIDVQWLPLLHRSLVVRQLTLEAARIDLERLRDAGWTLERFQRLDPATELPAGWSFALERIVLRDTKVRTHDVLTTDTPALDVAVRDARVSTRPQRPSAFGRAPNLRVDASVDGGRLIVTGSSDLRADGVAIEARVDMKEVPLDRLAAYRPAPLQSSVAGQMSGRLHYQRDPGRRDRLTGRLRGRHITVHVAALGEPALAIRRVEAAVDRIDLLQGRVAIGTLMLYGARLAVRPDLAAPVPLLDGLAPASAEPIGRHRTARPAARAATWTWTIGHVASPFARLLVAGAAEDQSLAADVTGENIGPGAYWSPVRARIGWDGGTATFDGTARMTHGFTLEGRLTASDVDATAVARAIGPPLATLVQAGRGNADLNVDLALGDTTGSARDMRARIDDKAPPLDVRGRISLGDLWLAGPDPNAFAVGARAVDLELAGVVPAKDRTQPSEISFATASVESPYVKVTRTVEGWSPDTATRAAPTEPERAAPAITLAVTDVRARNGRLLVTDQVATPNLVLDLAAVDGWARELRMPLAGFGQFMLQGTDRRLGPMRLAGERYGSDVTAELSLPSVNLAAVAPYLQRAGLPYVFTAGTGAVQARVALGGGGDRWNADTTLTLIDPMLGGDEGVLEQSLGMTPEAAFAALRERHGDVSLQLPLGSPGWTGGRALNDKVAGAVLAALSRPRLAALPDGPLGVGFAAGRMEPGPQAMRQLAAIAEILAARPDATVELQGAISRVDRRWLAEQAVAAEQAERTDEPGGLRGFLRAVGFRDQQTRIRDALEARGAGEPGRLDPDDEYALGALVAAGPSIPDDRLVGLAAARAMLVASLLADRYGVTAPRVVVAEPAAQESAASTVVDARFRVMRPGPAPW